MRKLPKLTLLVTVFFTLGMVSIPVYAEQRSGSGGTSSNDSSGTTSKSTDSTTATTGSPSTNDERPRPAVAAMATENETSRNSSGNTQLSEPKASLRLEANKLKLCLRREAKINNIMARIADRGQKQIDLFTTIANRVEAFYTARGKTLSNYDALVAALNTQKSHAQQAVDGIKNTSVTFQCDGGDPKGAAQSFQTALKSEIQALKDYRTAVKNLIVGVKSVQGTTSSDAGGNQ